MDYPEELLIPGVHGNVSEKAIQARGGARGEPGEVWNDLILTMGNRLLWQARFQESRDCYGRNDRGLLRGRYAAPPAESIAHEHDAHDGAQRRPGRIGKRTPQYSTSGVW
jgi:hypothetical protein